MKVVCIGHSTFDTTLPVDFYPVENKKYRINSHIECGGGPASNACYLLAKWGMDTSIVSVIGNDYYGDLVLKDYNSVNVGVEYLERRDDFLTSSSYIVANTSNGSRTILTSKCEPIRKLSREVNIRADVILVDGEHPLTAIEVLDNNKDAISILDAGRLNDDTRIIGKKVKYLACSKDFAEDFCSLKIDNNNREQLIEVYDKLDAYFNNQIIITLEADGAFTKYNDNYTFIPSIKVKAIDSTGAGDIFHGALTYFLANNYDLLDAIRYACITGGISVMTLGSRNSIPSLDEVLDYDYVI